MSAPESARLPARPLFLVLDGLDGCGKSTQARRLTETLGKVRAAVGAQPPLHLREPGGTRLGEALRGLLLDRGQAPRPAVEVLLFAASRRQMLEEAVAPALAAGRDVVCERFHASTFAYQAVAGGQDEEAVLALLECWAGEPRPDVEWILDLEPEEALARRGGARDRIEDLGLAHQRRVAEGYRRYAGRVDRARRIDARCGEEQLAALLWEDLTRAVDRT